jgi:hypothetical protein
MPWFILSAKYGLLHPDSEVDTYECTLNTMSIAERRDWADQVSAALRRDVKDVARIVVLAGQRYREFLMPVLTQLCSDVRVPLEGLRIGEQLAWFNANR